LNYELTEGFGCGRLETAQGRSAQHSGSQTSRNNTNFIFEQKSQKIFRSMYLKEMEKRKWK
jgi:hypothetical protein